MKGDTLTSTGITPITQQEFEEVAGISNKGASPTPELIAVRKLAPLTGMKLACRWNHTGRFRHCGGGTVLAAGAKRAGFKVSTRCKDGTLYVFRYE